MSWQNRQQLEWAMKDPITTEVRPGMAMPMQVIRGSLEGESPSPSSGVSGVQSGPQPPVEISGAQPGPSLQSEAASTASPFRGGSQNSNPNCLPGLEAIIGLDLFFVQQQIAVFEVISGWASKKRYAVKNSSGEILFQIEEESNWCVRCFCGSYRPFVMKIYNSAMNEVMILYRPFRCTSWLCPCYLQEMEVYARGSKIGSIVQNWNLLRPSFSICDVNDITLLVIKGPVFRCRCLKADFKIFSSDGKNQIGVISKRKSGLIQQFSTANHLGVNFPADLDVKVKALLMAGCLLTDFMYFKKTAKCFGNW